MKDLPFALHFPLQGEGMSRRAVVSSVEQWVMCGFARLHKIRLCKTRPGSFQGSEPPCPTGECHVSYGEGLPFP